MTIRLTSSEAIRAAKNWPAFAMEVSRATTDGDRLVVTLPPVTMAPKRAPAGAPATGGPGTELKRLLAAAGILPGDCQCEARAQHMDEMGPDWCAANIGTIVGWLAAEAGARGKPFSRVAAWLLVEAAIFAARLRGYARRVANN